MHKRPFLFAETAFHHEGDLDYILSLINLAAEAKVDGIKFQVLIDLNELISSQNPAFEKLKPYVFTLGQWTQIFDYAIRAGLSIIVMPLDAQSFILTERYRKNIRYIELHSVAFNDKDLRAAIKQSGIDLILGAGGRTREEIAEIVQYFGTQLTTLMAGFQAFPSAIEDIRLRRIAELKKDFPTLEIGYADHSSFDDQWAVDSNSLAYVLGATIFEKHITLREGEKRVDFEAAVGLDKLKRIKLILESHYRILFEYADSYGMTQAEINYRNRQKMTVAKRNIGKGEVLKREDLALKMVGRFDGFSQLDDLIGKALKNPVAADYIIRPEDVDS
jgi:N,N'-diacetyllegionaminate synthase